MMWNHVRYPDESNGEWGEMLITTENGSLKIGIWDGFYWEYDGAYHTAESVKAWMKLPEPYDERSERR